MKRMVVGTVVLMTLAVAATALGKNDRGWWGSGSGKRGSGDMVTETRTVDSFSHIETSGAFDIRVTIGSPQSVSITFDDNLIDLVTTRVKRGTLIVESEGSFSTRSSCELVITVPSLESIYSSGSGEFSIDRLQEKRFTVELDGSGNVEATGTVEELEVAINGSGNVNFRALEATNALVEIEGSGNVKVAAKENLEGRISGSGNIMYYGEPSVRNVDVSGSGSLVRARK